VFEEDHVQVAAALSRTADPGLAAAEAADAAGVELDGAVVGLAIVLVTPEHADGLASAAAAVEARLEPEVLLGAVAQGVIGPGEELESGPGVVVWCAHLGAGRAVPFRAWTLRPERGGIAVAGWPDTAPGQLSLVLADPFSFPMAEVARRIGQERPGQPMVGGLLTGGQGLSRLLLDGQIHEDGAVGVVLEDVPARTVVSQGCRPVGEPLTVTGVERNRIHELAGRPAIDVLRQLVEDVGEHDRELLDRGGLHIGLVVDEVRDDYDTGDFLIRGVVGVDPEASTITVGDIVALGQTVQFHLRDADSARRDLDARLEGLLPAAGGLLFTCNGRGQGLFGEPDHDVRRVGAQAGGPIAGAFCAGELGPVGPSSHLHGFTASIVLLDEEDPEGVTGV
jgi:small ligand-binding sensory domain FIST